MGGSPERSRSTGDPRRRLASVTAVLEERSIRDLVARHTRPLVLDAIRETLDGFRERLGPGDAAPELGRIVEAVRDRLGAVEFHRIRRVVNATGILLHTGLGRAILPPPVVADLGTLDRCVNVQIDLETGLRGKRSFVTEHLLRRLTGAEAALVVNNNAAATFLMLAVLCRGREVVVSRGELIEIGGSFRLPDCIHESGSTLVEVGTTNRTHLRDYERAISERTAAILRVHPSNYRVEGFTEAVPLEELARLKAERGVMLFDDVGSGALIDFSRFGLPREATVAESVSGGADLVCFSGDKLLAGPQAGILVGRRDLLARIRKHPLTRLLRVGKLTDLALERTLRLYLEPERLPERHPVLRMIAADIGALESRARRLKERLESAGSGLTLEVREEASATGGGSLTGIPLPTRVLAVASPDLPPGSLAAGLRRHEPPVIARMHAGAVLLDMRTLLEGDDDVVFEALRRVEESGKGDGR